MVGADMPPLSWGKTQGRTQPRPRSAPQSGSLRYTLTDEECLGFGTY